MPKYPLVFCKVKFSITADSWEEARVKAAKKLSKLLRDKVPKSAIYVHKDPI